MSRNAKRKRFERAANPFGVGMRGGSGVPGNVYVLPESVIKQVIANFAPQKQKSEMYSPGAPITPIPEITPKAGPRIFSYNTGYNISGVDRTLGRTNYDIPSFQQLRMLAKLYAGIGLCERVILDMIPLLELDIVPVQGLLGDNETADKYQKDITTYKQWFEKPDRVHDTHSWLRMAWREQTQVDELYIFKQRNRSGGLYALQIVDGTQMKPLLNEQGVMPDPPYPAYQQFPYGAPGGLYTADQFIHYQESPQADSPYGFSRIERIILNVNIALRKQNKDLYRYTEGNIPAGIMEVPEASGWTPDQIDAYEQSWNALMAGNQQQSVRVKFTQPGMKYSAFDQPEGQLHLTEFDQFLLNITAAAYGLSMQDLAFTGDIHKSSGDSQQNVMYRRTLYPLIKVYAKLFTDVLRNDFHENRFEVIFRGFEEQEDVQGLATAYSTLTNAGILGLSDAAKLMKLPEDPKAAHIGRILLGKDGPIFLDDIASEKMRQAQMAATMAGYKMAANPPTPGENASSTNGKGASATNSPPGGDEEDQDVDQAMSDADKSVASLERSDPVRGPGGEFGYNGGPKKHAGDHHGGAHTGAHHTGPKVSAKAHMQARTQKLAARFGKLANRKISKKWTAAQQAAAGQLQKTFEQIASAISKGGQSDAIDTLLDTANTQAKALFGSNAKGLNAFRGALTKIDTANDKWLLRAMVGEDEHDGQDFDALDELLAVWEMEDYEDEPWTPQNAETEERVDRDPGRETRSDASQGTQQDVVLYATAGLYPDSGTDARADYKRWRTRAIEDAKAGKQQRGFTSTAIPASMHGYISQLLHVCTTADEVRAVFTRAQQQESEIAGSDQMLVYNAKLDIWEPEDTEQQLERMRAEGVKYLEWETHASLSGVCPLCDQNVGQVVALGQPFKSGHRLPQCHRYCQCGVKRYTEKPIGRSVEV